MFESMDLIGRCKEISKEATREHYTYGYTRNRVDHREDERSILSYFKKGQGRALSSREKKI